MGCCKMERFLKQRKHLLSLYLFVIMTKECGDSGDLVFKPIGAIHDLDNQFGPLSVRTTVNSSCEKVLDNSKKNGRKE